MSDQLFKGVLMKIWPTSVTMGAAECWARLWKCSYWDACYGNWVLQFAPLLWVLSTWKSIRGLFWKSGPASLSAAVSGKMGGSAISLPHHSACEDKFIDLLYVRCSDNSAARGGSCRSQCNAFPDTPIICESMSVSKGVEQETESQGVCQLCVKLIILLVCRIFIYYYLSCGTT